VTFRPAPTLAPNEMPLCGRCGSGMVQRGHIREDGTQGWACRPCATAWKRAARAKVGGSRAYARLWEKDNREKYLAHKAVWGAIRDGRLVRQPCERCGSPDSHAHHEDYSRRFDVMWLCALHHKERHRESSR
jgi:hypothetical protein